MEAWRGSHHALAMQAASESTVRGNFADTSITHGGVTSTFFRRGGRFWVRTEGPDGEPADFEITHTFGVYPLQQYLVPFPGGRLQALGIAWDSRPLEEGGTRWFPLYPDDPPKPGDPLHWTRRDQTWNYQCAECHSTDLRKNYDAARDRYATTWAEMSVGCEACHGPGSLHDAWARREPGWERVDGDAKGLAVELRRSEGEWIVKDPTRGIAEWSGEPRAGREVDACARCHSRRSVSLDPYRHGAPLLDTHLPALLIEPLYYADGQIREEVYEYGSFLQSRMSRAGVTCSDCHEPHSLELRGDANAVCAQCHLPARFDAVSHHHHAPGSAAARCIACHMPGRTYMIVDERRDHSFRVPRPDLTVALGTPNACTGCHDEQGAPWATDAIESWSGGERNPKPHFATALDAGRRGRLGAERLLGMLIGDESQPAIARATALSLLPEFLTSGSAASLSTALSDPDALVRAAAAGVVAVVPLEHRAAFAIPLLADPVRAVRIAAARALADTPRATLDATEQSTLDRALGEAIAAERVNEERPEAHLNLANLYARLGQPTDAESELLTARRLDPTFVPALVNLADLARAAGSDADTERYLAEALEIEPGNADVVHAIGLLRVRQGRTREALELFDRAAELAPDSVRYAYVRAIALHSTGDAMGALAVLERAHEVRPAHRDVLVALIDIAREQGDIATARRHAQTLATLLPEDPRVLSLLRALEAESP
jgi:Flp pilus assembly protein TadD